MLRSACVLLHRYPAVVDSVEKTYPGKWVKLRHGAGKAFKRRSRPCKGALTEPG
jgi:hypothetical protein